MKINIENFGKKRNCKKKKSQNTSKNYNDQNSKL